MSYSIPIELKILSQNINQLKDFIKKLDIKNNTMIFLSENCYTWLKDNSIYIEQPTTKVFRQQDEFDNTKAYIESINIDSSNCSFLKSIMSDDYYYKYSNGIPQKILMIILENEKESFNYDISVSVIESNSSSNPVDCIINTPSIFSDSIVFLNSTSYSKLKKNTNTISNNYNYERLIWSPDERYPGGNIMLHRLNYGRLYMLCNMNFPFFKKDFSFKEIPKSIYFIT